MKQWNEAFKKHGYIFTERHEDIDNVVKLFQEHSVRRVLDLGCGSGRHTVYLAKKGFDVFGIDIAEAGIKLTKDWLRKDNLKVNLKMGNIYKKLPYNDNFFDAVISTATLHHEKIENIHKAIGEIERILKPGGLIFITFRKRKFRNFHPNQTIIEKYGKQRYNYKVIAPRTYVPIEGGEIGLVHYLFNKELIRKEFKNFRIPKIWVDSNGRHYCFWGQLKIES
jgi:ubiquinone/menaquinone biosynthesis C-methylase UbiE